MKVGLEALPKSGDDERLVYTVTEAAELLGISRAFAYELVARGELRSSDSVAGAWFPESPWRSWSPRERLHRT
jgi:hypothetical protein